MDDNEDILGTNNPSFGGNGAKAAGKIVGKIVRGIAEGEVISNLNTDENDDDTTDDNSGDGGGFFSNVRDFVIGFAKSFFFR